MNWEPYREAFYNYDRSAHKSRVLTLLAQLLLDDFPSLLPQALKAQMFLALDAVARLQQSAKEDMQEASLGEIAARTFGDVGPVLELSSGREVRILHKFFESMFFVLHLTRWGEVQTEGKIPTLQIDFLRLAYSQELVMLFAHLDAFVSDSVRHICRAKPDVLKSNRKIEWETILSCNGWDQLLERLTEDFVYEFGWKSIPDRVATLRDRFGLEVKCPEEELEILQRAEQDRHSVIHNGGRASKDYLERTGRDDVSLGDPIPLTLEYLDKVFFAAGLLATEIFSEISRKFFAVAQERLDRLPHYERMQKS